MVLPKDGGYLNTSFELSGIGGVLKLNLWTLYRKFSQNFQFKDVKYFKINQDYQYSKQFFKYLVCSILNLILFKNKIYF